MTTRVPIRIITPTQCGQSRLRSVLRSPVAAPANNTKMTMVSVDQTVVFHGMLTTKISDGVTRDVKPAAKKYNRHDFVSATRIATQTHMTNIAKLVAGYHSASSA